MDVQIGALGKLVEKRAKGQRAAFHCGFIGADRARFTGGMNSRRRLSAEKNRGNKYSQDSKRGMDRAAHNCLPY